MNLKIIDIGVDDTPKPIVLVVDDETNVQSLVYDTLSDHYRVVSAFNGREATKKAESVEPDLILMDIVMPDMGGYEAVRALQENPHTKSLPVLIFTAQDFDASTIQMLKNEPNVVGFVTKPFKPKSLRETVRMALQKKTNK
jgi:CheY-like chemotaxis protein